MRVSNFNLKFQNINKNGPNHLISNKKKVVKTTQTKFQIKMDQHME
jgi:hypothetical protein